jgi:threonine dehydratase
MQLAWRSGSAAPAPSTSIADGIAVRVPIPEAVEHMRRLVHDVVLVSDEEMVDAMRLLLSDAGLVVEPSGAAGVAAIAQRRGELAGKRVATVLTGGNITEEQLGAFIGAPGQPADPARPADQPA